jgi:hypothetical protein
MILNHNCKYWPANFQSVIYPTKQAEVELTDINSMGERNDYCDTEVKVGFWKEECDWDDFTFDSVA